MFTILRPTFSTSYYAYSDFTHSEVYIVEQKNALFGKSIHFLDINSGTDLWELNRKAFSGDFIISTPVIPHQLIVSSSTFGQKFKLLLGGGTIAFKNRGFLGAGFDILINETKELIATFDLPLFGMNEIGRVNFVGGFDTDGHPKVLKNRMFLCPNSNIALSVAAIEQLIIFVCCTLHIVDEMRRKKRRDDAARRRRLAQFH